MLYLPVVILPVLAPEGKIIYLHTCSMAVKAKCMPKFARHASDSQLECIASTVYRRLTTLPDSA